jgi:hypothetical protein
VFRQSAACYSGFLAPKDLAVSNDDSAREVFHQRVADQLGCATDAVAIQLFTRLRPDTVTGEEVDLYQISLHHTTVVNECRLKHRNGPIRFPNAESNRGARLDGNFQ